MRAGKHNGLSKAPTLPEAGKMGTRKIKGRQMLKAKDARLRRPLQVVWRTWRCGDDAFSVGAWCRLGRARLLKMPGYAGRYRWCGGLGDALMTRLVLRLGVGWGGRGCWSGRDVGGGVGVHCGRRAGGGRRGQGGIARTGGIGLFYWFGGVNAGGAGAQAEFLQGGGVDLAAGIEAVGGLKFLHGGDGIGIPLAVGFAFEVAAAG